MYWVSKINGVSAVSKRVSPVDALVTLKANGLWVKLNCNPELFEDAFSLLGRGRTCSWT